MTKTKWEKITVHKLRLNGIMVLDVAQFDKLIDNIAFLRGENAGVKTCVETSNFAKGSYYIGTIEEAKRAIDDGPYWD